jgi:hypothetical protein
MTSSLMASAQVLASPIPEILVLVTLVVLLALRAWSGATGWVVHRRVSHLLTGSIVLFLVLFVILVVERFKTVG